MFTEARIKLTLFYLTIIMVISIFFSAIIYQGATFELSRIQNRQRIMRPNSAFVIDPDIVRETKNRIFISLLALNGIILIGSGLSGYFLAGKTLSPIQKMMDEQKEFISNASHELRTPLAALKSQIEVGLRSKKISTKDLIELLKSNLDDVNNMTKLSDYLLKLNKQQNAKVEFKKVDLTKIIKEVAGTRNFKLNLTNTVVRGDRDSLKELVSILLDNAIKYGGGKEISLSLRNKILKITDHGIGIPEEDLPHVFDRFFRGDKARSHDGYGLGLSIAKQIADNHNAKIKVESKLGFGTTFKVIFS
ncbi:MAG: HAMP domain-containing sensor histidine kinase [Patescibacteria group bacterium]